MAKRTLIARGFGIVGCVASVVWFGCFASVYLTATDGHIDGSGSVLGLDFMVFWSSGVLTEQGHLLDLFDRASFHALTEALFAHELPVKPRIWTYPPPMLLVTVPFGWLPYLWALAAWSAIFLAAYLLATRMLALLAAPSTMANLFFGQTGFLVAALFFGALRLLGRRPFLAGALFGLIVVKPHLGVMIPVALLAARAWLAFAGAALTVVALALLSGLLFGWEAWRLWFLEVVAPDLGHPHGHRRRHHAVGLAGRQPSGRAQSGSLGCAGARHDDRGCCDVVGVLAPASRADRSAARVLDPPAGDMHGDALRPVLRLDAGRPGGDLGFGGMVTQGVDAHRDGSDGPRRVPALAGDLVVADDVDRTGPGRAHDGGDRGAGGVVVGGAQHDPGRRRVLA